MTIELRESVAVAPVRKGARWKVIVATPGQGSSGFYSEELLRRDAHKIVPAGGQSFINHDISRNPKDLIGFFPEGSYWSDEDSAVVGDLEVFKHWQDFVAEIAPHVGMSLFASGECDEDGNITEIFEDRMNGCDLVARPGLEGSGFSELYESARAGSDKPSVRAAGDELLEVLMDEKLDKLIELMSSLVAEKESKAQESAQVEADTAAVNTAVEAFKAAVKAVDGADLLASQKEAILEAASAGQDVAPLIEAAVKVKAEAEALFVEQAESQGRVVSEGGRFASAVDLGKVFG